MASDAPSGDSIVLRSLEAGDYEKGFLSILAQLTTVGDISKEKFNEQFERINASKDYHVVVAEMEGRIVGSATLLVEHKFIHDCGCVGHIEDVVVDKEIRGKQLGKRLIMELLKRSQADGCYKTILDCAQDNVAFYAKCGLKTKEIQMVLYH
uniref:Glucosamine 6-phosphate N-acetyltransferase n=1 Tax=Palpitomonas bilix TaxID=652834 RepID=A0A7S3G727_9EUKA|mmetsp:Transcript_31181/g.81808  ORF Transcript_31181/g.81808 Transcript_31181/m.81808 type:complete len:152 (+) Transcript_31181:20-475(+)